MEAPLPSLQHEKKVLVSHSLELCPQPHASLMVQKKNWYSTADPCGTIVSVLFMFELAIHNQVLCLHNQNSLLL